MNTNDAKETYKQYCMPINDNEAYTNDTKTHNNDEPNTSSTKETYKKIM